VAWLAIPASAQVSLPRVAVPELPVHVPIPDAGRLDPIFATLTQARSLRAERLLSEHRAELDRSPPGDLIVRAQVVGIDITEEALARAQKAQFVVVRTRELVDLGVKITVLQTPEGMNASRGLKRLRKLDPEGTYDYNHVYLDSGTEVADAAPRAKLNRRCSRRDRPRGTHRWRRRPKHEVFAGIRIHHNGCDGNVVPSPHGTAVAHLLVSRNAVGEIFAADVYCGEAAGGAVDAVSAAFGWMARERVRSSM
jgi:hypothetical protein